MAGIVAAEEVNAKKTTWRAADALELARQANEIYVATRRDVVHLNMKKDNPDDATLSKLILGPTGNLRAPALRKDKTLVIGFDAETYGKVFG
jgi:arsenate reductase-like glutaredoxin family protein